LGGWRAHVGAVVVRIGEVGPQRDHPVVARERLGRASPSELDRGQRIEGIEMDGIWDRAVRP
jgi:hypothetical protein